MNYHLGLDIGTASVGWAVLNVEDKKIIALGVRRFEEPRVPKTNETLTAERRLKRAGRRSVRRKCFRRERLLRLFRAEGLISEEECRASRQNEANSDNIFYIAPKSEVPSPWELRAEGLHRLLDRRDWVRVLFHLGKYRGYQSNAVERELDESKVSDKGLLLTGVEDMKRKFREFRDSSGGPHSIGEMIYREFESQKTNPNRRIRNIKGTYSRTVGREEILAELALLFDIQRELSNPHSQEDFQDQVLRIVNSRRHFSEGPGGDSPYGGNLIARMVGKCTLEPNKSRAPRDSMAGVKFRLYQNLNSVRIVEAGGYKGDPLNPEQKKLAAQAALAKAQFSYADLRNVIGLSEGAFFKNIYYTISFRDIQGRIYDCDAAFYRENISGSREQGRELVAGLSRILGKRGARDIEEKLQRCLTMANFPAGKRTKFAEDLVKEFAEPEKQKLLLEQTKLYRIRSILRRADCQGDDDFLNRLCFILAVYREEQLLEKLGDIGLDCNVVTSLSKLPLSKFLHLSVAAVERLLPYLEDGDRYEEACSKCGYGHIASALSRDEVRNPTVFRALKQTQKVIRALGHKYGEPNMVYLEVSRDLSRSKKDRDRIAIEYNKNQAKMKEELGAFAKVVGREPIGREAQVWRFYKEQNGLCLYCGQALIASGDVAELFSKLGAPSIEIEHTLPYLRSFDNREYNKTVACSACNRLKKNRTPFEFFGQNGEGKAWLEFVARCGSIEEENKLKLLLTEDWDEESESERRLTDTRYITRLVQVWLEDSYQNLVATATKGRPRSIYAVQGSVTATMRRVWALEHLKYSVGEGGEKLRNSEKNHALDAAVVAAAGLSTVRVLSRNYRSRERRGEIGGAWKMRDKTKKLLPQPWPDFSEELKAFYTDDPTNSLIRIGEETARKYGIEEPESRKIEPIFVSWRVRRGVKGSVHKGTIFRVSEGPSKHKKGGPVPIYYKKKPLRRLTFRDLEKMDGRCTADGTVLPLYLGLKRRLEKYDGDAQKAFAEPFYKPSFKNLEPESGTLVKGIRVERPVGGAVRVSGGAAANGCMIRVDIFRAKSVRRGSGPYRFLVVPIYTKHRAMAELPMRAVIQHREEQDWLEVREEEFYCSLYPNDFVRIESEKGVEEGYYINFDISADKLSMWSHETIRKGKPPLRVGIKTRVNRLTKYQVDVLGERHRMRLPERRMPLSWPGQKG
ncbi:type II CRISPR RNA-guided endonuclease Cas9 [Candidatus Haliotispira prima]|uniref:CRISPR-associated endonuclease Cas9 n=1 Tax=Candidatus Haliotispira prima TaxID=3034016 RepID=A0ABY8MKQ0_9SPIO|nr:type II CRISPR RNA-guided endonuclease Cas9 [Candidatus Haliotispira prima]WGK69773.1 type II CRISPR RNA-guided endonuclease Cas9 [Candidatus Haliotispira prima]